MPWCPGCDRFLSPSTVTPTGDCPRCGGAVDPGRARTSASPGAPPAPVAVDPPPDGGGIADEPETVPLPWHFKLLVGAIALYLGWRAVQGVEWVIHRF